MIKNEFVKKNHNGYTEEYDIEGLRDLATMAARYVIKDSYGGLFTVKGRDVPDGSYSDFSCNVWELMTALIRYGASLERERWDSGLSDEDDIRFRLGHAAYLDRIDIKLRE